MSREAPQIVFVCTGNIFRSISAELSLRSHSPTSVIATSAGIEAKIQPMHEDVEARLRELKLDPSKHIQRKLDSKILATADLVVAMGLDHKEFMLKTFNYEAPLFNEIALGNSSPVLDLHEMLPDWEKKREASRQYIRSVIDHIFSSMPKFVRNYPEFISKAR